MYAIVNIKFNLLFPLLLLCSVANAEPLDTSSLEAILESRVSGDQGAGLVVGLIDGKNTEVNSVGVSDKKTNSLLKDSSIFEIGSITKTFTGIILADMVIKGEVKLDDPVAKYLPKGTVVPTRNGQHITLLSLATHRSSLPRLPTNLLQHTKDMANPYATYRIEHLYEFLESYQLTRDINETAEYSNLGMGLLAHSLALTAGVSYEMLVKERILIPLRMLKTSIVISADNLPSFATGHDNEGNEAAHWDLPTLAGAGALRSTIKDMMNYLAANMGIIDSPLSAAIELSHKLNYTMAGNDIGLAWLTKTHAEETITWHNGGTGGFRSYIGFDKSRGRGVVVLANSQDNVDEIGLAVLQNKVSSLIAEEFDPITLTATQLAQFVGTYQLAPNFNLTISQRGDSLYAQATGQSKHPLFAKSNNEFFFKVVKASITFSADSKGAIDSLVLHQNGDHRGKKIE